MESTTDEININPNQTPEAIVAELGTIPVWKKILTTTREMMKVPLIPQGASGAEVREQILEALKTHAPRKVWDGDVTDTAVIEAILKSTSSEDFVDPRTNLQTQCIMIGRANAGMPTRDIVSYCVSADETTCTKVCFSVDEIIEHVTGSPQDQPVSNPWANELRQKVPALAANVPDVLPPDFIEVAQWQHQAIRSNNTMMQDLRLDKTDMSIFTWITGLFMGFFQAVPGAMTVGNWITSAANAVTSFIPGLKWVLSSVGSFFMWIINNPFWNNLLICVSKSLRMFLCCWLSGISADEIKVILKGMFNTITNTPMIGFFIDMTAALVSCATSVWTGTLGIMTCLKNVLMAALGSFGSLATWVAQGVEYIFKAILDSIPIPGWMGKDWLKDNMGKIVSCISNPRLCVDYMTGNKAAGIELNVTTAVRDEFFGNFANTIMWAFLYMLPAYTLDWLIAILAPLLPGGGYIDQAKNMLLSLIERFTGYDISIGDIVILYLKMNQSVGSVMMLFREAMAWITDVGACAFAKLKVAFMPAFGLASDEGLDPQPCCFRGLVEQIKKAFTPEEDPGILEKAGKVMNKVVDAAKWVGNFFTRSDRRLKILLASKPVYTMRFGGKKVKFYIYSWNPRAIAKLPRAWRKKFDLNGVYIGVMAQELKKVFPEAVTTDARGYYQIKIAALPCPLITTLCILNDKPIPRRCTKKVIVPKI